MKRFSAILCFIAITIPIFSLAANECDAILEQGIRNTYYQINKSDFRSNFQSAFCNKSSTSNSSSGGKSGGIGVGYGNFKLELNGNSSENQLNQTQNQYCHNESSSMSDEGYAQALSLVADPNIVSAWQACTKNSGGLLLTGTVEDDAYVRIALRFRNWGSIHQTTITDNPSALGMYCKNLPQKGDVINGSVRNFTCERIGNQPVILDINSEIDGATLYIPPKRELPVIPDPVIPKPEPIKPKFTKQGCMNLTGGVFPASGPCYDSIRNFCVDDKGDFITFRLQSGFKCPNGQQATIAYSD
ncbi:hypothetical protein SC171_05425 [Pantoea cypripedii]|uniref:hypothetical protein n=1 Tax=Pantoea cypripedii TaxID=55209 RepID=UPI002FC778A1